MKIFKGYIYDREDGIILRILEGLCMMDDLYFYVDGHIGEYEAGMIFGLFFMKVISIVIDTFSTSILVPYFFYIIHLMRYLINLCEMGI